MSMDDAVFDILFIGGACVDIILQVPRLPVPDEKLVANYVGRQAGGLVANTACAAARLGLQTTWVGDLGDDENGAGVIDSFRQFSVNVDYIRRTPDIETDFTVILLDPSGERTILVVPASKPSSVLDQTTLNLASRCKISYCLPRALDWFDPLARAVHDGGGKVAIDIEASSPVQGTELAQVLQQVDVVFCSAGGLKLASGSDDPETGCEKILSYGVSCVVVTLGSRGAWGVTRSERLFVPAYQVQVVDTTGAGDCFHAAFLSQYLEGKPLAGCLKFASAASALSVQEIGPRAGLPDREMVEKFMMTHLSMISNG